jgi:hypothetical protein
MRELSKHPANTLRRQTVSKTPVKPTNLPSSETFKEKFLSGSALLWDHLEHIDLGEMVELMLIWNLIKLDLKLIKPHTSWNYGLAVMKL